MNRYVVLKDYSCHSFNNSEAENSLLTKEKTGSAKLSDLFEIIYSNI